MYAVTTHQLVADLQDARRRTLDLVAGLGDADLTRPLDPIMSPLVWDLGHIAAYEDLWCVHRLAAEPLLRADLAEVYDAFETPRAVRGDIELLGAAAVVEYLGAVRERTLGVLEERGPDELHELVLRHELQHTETMRQALFLGGLPGGRAPSMPSLLSPAPYLDVPEGPFVMGADPSGFAYDNERPRRLVHVPAFRITRTPVTCASFETFVDGGGYHRREWWSDEGWSWRRRTGVDRPLGWEDGGPRDPGAPVEHVSWFEAAAFARSQGARLPTEAEWEKAAQAGLPGVGLVWEWTSTEFDGYPGFAAHPYREYSEVFFRKGYRVLRGGSWASSPRVATLTFRNWDLPERRQIFSGIRLVEAP